MHEHPASYWSTPVCRWVCAGMLAACWPSAWANSNQAYPVVIPLLEGHSKLCQSTQSACKLVLSGSSVDWYKNTAVQRSARELRNLLAGRSSSVLIGKTRAAWPLSPPEFFYGSFLNSVCFSGESLVKSVQWRGSYKVLPTNVLTFFNVYIYVCEHGLNA